MQFSDEAKFMLDRMTAQTPTLVLGAGFSVGAYNQRRKILPVGERLAKDLFDNILSKSSKVDKNDLNEYYEDRSDLKKICDAIRLEGLVEERNRYLQQIFSGCECPAGDNHLLLKNYPWHHIFTLNIDDLVEYIYSDCAPKDRPIVHVKQASSLDSGASVELHKLHGSVNCPESGYIFDSEEYRKFIAAPCWSLEIFGHLYVTGDVIFLGTEFQEDDLLQMIAKVGELITITRPYHYFFVSPEIHNRTLRRKIRDNPNMHHISWKTDQFLTAIQENITNVGAMRRKMRDYGMVFYDEQFKQSRSSVGQYMSELYLGAPPRPLDFFTNVDIVRPMLQGKALQLSSAGRHHLIILYGEAYVGKTCSAIRLGVDLMNCGYDFSIFNLPYSMNAVTYQDRILEYLHSLPVGSKVSIFAENMPFYYSQVKRILEKCPSNISSLVFICTGNRQDHNSKKYLLDKFENTETIFISEETKNSCFANCIYDTLEKTNHLNKLRTYGEKSDCVKFIQKRNDLIDVLYISQEGRQFVRHFSGIINEKKDSPNKKAFLALCCLSTLNVSEISAALFVSLMEHSGIDVKMQRFFEEYEDLIRLRDDRIALRCSRLLWVSAQDYLNKDEVLGWIKQSSLFLAKTLVEHEESLTNEIFQKIIKVKNLRQDLRIANDLLLSLFMEMCETCKHLSYYWVQRGILHRDMEQFEEANNALSEAADIRNNTSYHIKHAQAKNYMAWGVWAVQHEPTFAPYYFDMGQEQLEDLIQRASHRYFAYSVHTLTDMMIKYQLARNIPMPYSKLQMLAEYLKVLVSEEDKLRMSITYDFLNYCNKIGCHSPAVKDLRQIYYEQLQKNDVSNQTTYSFDSDDLVDNRNFDN